MEHVHADARPSILIVEPDVQVRTQLERFFSRVGWTFKSWGGESRNTPWGREEIFDLVVADSVSLQWDSWKDLRTQQQRNRDSAFVLLVNPELGESAPFGGDAILCCIEKDTIPQTIESSLECLVGEFERIRREGRLATRPRVPVGVQLTIETFTSRELADIGFPFPILGQLHDAGLLSLNEKLKLQLALQEAVANSLEHGNLELVSEWKEEIDKDGIDRYAQVKLERLADDRYGERMITIVSDFDCERLLIRITDQGKGFIPPERKKTKSDDHNIAVFGRGMALIDSAVDEVSYAQGGRQISMIKHIVTAREN